MAKYVTVGISGIITNIAKETDVPGYTVGVVEIFFPDEHEMEGWSKKQEKDWILENNKRMEGICNYLNESNL